MQFVTQNLSETALTIFEQCGIDLVDNIIQSDYFYVNLITDTETDRRTEKRPIKHKEMF